MLNKPTKPDLKGPTITLILTLSHRRHDIQHNDTQHNDIQHNDTQHYDTQHNDTK
jgi:hypothetical protein